MLINGIKFACNTCVKGHRSSNCNHIERPLFEIRKKGRPVTQCTFCRDLRKTRQIHIKCTCTDKTKNIENTATQQQCYQCPSKSEEQGVSYSDLIQTSLLNNGQMQQDAPIQCTCHETANKMLLYSTQHQQQEQQQWNQQQQQEPPILPVRPRGMIIEDSSSPGFQQKSSLRFLNTNKNRRRKSSISKKKRSSIQHVDEMMVADMQSFLFNQKQPEIETECAAAMMVQQQQQNVFSSSATTSSTSTPNSNYIKEKESDCGYNSNDIGLMMTDPVELTSLLNNVLNNNEKRHSIVEEEVIMEEQHPTQFMNSVEMTRSTTLNSFSSSSSIPTTATAGANNNFIVPQQQLCGSFTPHSNCSPAIDTQGESVVITITPLPTLFTSDEEQDRKLAAASSTVNKPVTRIVTCYCGNSCICPGCFVHPNNYLLAMQQQQYNMVPQQPSSNSSSYSSDDEDPQHYMNYTATTTSANYSLL